jgi:flagellar biosynthesis/type III secretory pathway protein FliH
MRSPRKTWRSGSITAPLTLSLTLSMIATATALAVGCSSEEEPPIPAPDFTISVGAGASSRGEVTPFNFGQIGVLTDKTQVFTVTNNGDLSGTIQGALSSADLGLADPFAAVIASAAAGLSPCASGTSLAPGAACLIAVSFGPKTLSSFESTMRLNYIAPSATDEDGQPTTPQSQQASLRLLGSSKLDCSISPELSASEQSGVLAAQTRMNEEAAQGAADARAAAALLTAEDGDRDGYNAGHRRGYDVGYNGPNGYDAGYRVGRQQGYDRGLNDPGSCNAGRNDGARDGRADGENDGGAEGYEDGYDYGFPEGAATGRADGEHNGWYDGRSDGVTDGETNGISDGARVGYDEGYDAGHPIGWDVGYYDGVDSCWKDGKGAQPKSPRSATQSGASASGKKSGVASPARGKKSAQKDGEDFVALCYEQGFNSKYDPSTYTRAYNQTYEVAKWENAAYKNAYEQAEPRGYNAGVAAGAAAGYAKGRQDGDAAGFAEGSDIQYRRCYAAEYPVAYAAWADYAYDQEFPVGRADGRTDGYAAAYAPAYEAYHEAGYASTYADSYDESFDAAYSYNHPIGWQDGWDVGYDDGFDQGRYDECGEFLSATKSALANSLKKEARALRGKPQAPKLTAVPETAKQKAKANASVSKPKKARKNAPKKGAKGYGASWKPEYRTHVRSRLPETVASLWTEEQRKAFASMSDGSKKGSLRHFLRKRNQAKGLVTSPKGLVTSPKADK